MIKINKKTRKIKRTKKFNRNVISKVFKNNIKRIIEKKTRKLKGGLKKKTAGELEFERDMNFLKEVIDIDKLQKIKTDKNVNIEDILPETSFDNKLIVTIKVIFEKYGIKTIHDLKNNVFKIKEKFSFFKKKKQNEQKGNILFISEEDRNKQEAKLWLTDYFYTQKSSGKTPRIEKLKKISNLKEKQDFVIFDNPSITYEDKKKPSDLILRYFEILNIKNMTNFNEQIPNSNKNSSEKFINNSTKSKEISHIWYKDWPDKGVPIDEKTYEFQLFCEKLKQDIIQNGKDITTLIHCSAGVGRTGTLYVILDLMFEYDIDNCDDLKNKIMDEEKLIQTVIDTITNARLYRTTIVQSSVQLQFILKVFGINIDLNTCINKHKKIKNYDTKADNNNECKLAKKCNNRYANILPFDEHIVKLTPENNNKDTDECKDYINASHMKDFKGGFKVIAAQCPQSDDIRNFNRMLFEHKVGIIAMLTNLIELGESKCSDYTTDSTLFLDKEKISILVRTLNLQKNKHNFTFTKKSEPSNYVVIN